MGKKKTDLSMDLVPSDRMVNTRTDPITSMYMSEDYALLKQAEDRIEASYSYFREIYNTSRNDVDFVYGEQWEARVLAERINRPTLTLNLLPQFINQVLGTAKKTKFSIHINQLSGKNDEIVDPSSTNNYSKTQIMEGIVRDIEDRSKAPDAYCDAYQHALEGGFGFLFVKTTANPDDPFNIELQIEHIRDRWSVYMDPLSIRRDFNDARYCAKTYEIEIAEFRVKWPDSKIDDYINSDRRRSSREGGGFFKGTESVVQVLDYWWKEPMVRTALELEMSAGAGVGDRIVVYEDEVEDTLDDLLDEGYEITQKKKVNTYRIKYMRCSRDEILDGPYNWPSKYLPIIPVIGRSIDLAEKTHWVGMFRYAHDAQLMYNYWASAATEKVSLAPKTPFIVGASQIAGHENDWAGINKNNKPYIVYNDDDETSQRPERSSTVAMATGELTMLDVTRGSLQEVVGLHDANLGKQTNEVSGVAIEGRKAQGETGTYDFIDSLVKSVTRVGEVCVDMVPRVYHNQHARRLIMPDDTQIIFNLNFMAVDKETGREFRINNLAYSRYSCRVTVGANEKTQRQEFVALMMEWGRSDPEGFRQIRHLIFEVIDAPNGRALAEVMKRLAPPETLSEEERKKLPPQEPTIDQQISQLQAQAEMKKAEAEIVKAESDVKIAEMKMKAEEAALQFEIEKGLNRGEDQKDKMSKKEDPQAQDMMMSPEVIAQIEKIVAKTLANIN